MEELDYQNLVEKVGYGSGGGGFGSSYGDSSKLAVPQVRARDPELLMDEIGRQRAQNS